MTRAQQWIVLKFGGTSVSRRHRWDTIGKLAVQRAQSQGEGGRVLIVVSALSGVTNELQAIAAGDAVETRIEQLEQRHREFGAELGLDVDTVLTERLASLRALASDPRRESLALDWQAEVLAQGELLSSTLGAAYLRSQGVDIGWCDARNWLTALQLPNQSAWSSRLSVNCQAVGKPEFRESFAQQPTSILITQGFIAAHPEGGTAILGRGGSDTSAAYFGALLQAQAVEIWTDVPGMFTANPREVPDARILSRLRYGEAQEIATTGAKVLHPRSIAPCRDAGVPIRILDTENPDLPGTRIDAQADPVQGVKAISARKGIVLVSMESIGMWQQVGFLADIFAIFRQHGLSIDLIGSSETNVTVSLDPSDNLMNSDVLSKLSADLSKVCIVKVIAPCAAVTLVGRGMRSLLHKLSDIWATFGKERVHLISQSSNDLNLTFVIDEEDVEGLIPAIHASLIKSGAMPVLNRQAFGPSWRELKEGRVEPHPRWWEQQVEQLLQIAAEGTPAYVYDVATVRARARNLAEIASVDARYFAIKANPHPQLLNALVEEGFGLECVSLAELRHVRQHVPQLTPQQILFTPSFAPRSEYIEALAQGVTVTIDSLEILERWPDVFRGQSVWLRVDLGHGEGHHDKVKTGGAEAKFGLPLAKFEAFLQLARRHQVTVTGLHAHLGSGIDNPDHWRQVFASLAGLAELSGSISTIDIGGGLSIPYTPDGKPFDLQAYAHGLSEIRRNYPGLRVAIEPGRYLVAESGVLLTQVTQIIEKDGVLRVGADAGMNALLRPSLYDAYHGIFNLSRLHDTQLQLTDIVGPICESGDVLGHDRLMPAATSEGDVLLIADTGAYGMVMANHYNLRDLPRELCIETK